MVLTAHEAVNTDRKQLIKQFFCSHDSYGRTGYEELVTERLPVGWTLEMDHDGVERAWSPTVCMKCGYVDADLRTPTLFPWRDE